MNAKVETADYAEAMPALKPGGFALSEMLSPIGQGIGKIVTTFRIANMVANRADRYYAMDDAQLAIIGLTRDGIPAALVRLFSELE
jgi:hypothetical protein